MAELERIGFETSRRLPKVVAFHYKDDGVGQQGRTDAAAVAARKSKMSERESAGRTKDPDG